MMKNFFMSFILLAVTVAAMASNGKNNVQPSPMTEAEIVNVVPDDEVPIAEQKEIVGKVYTIKVPEGWTARSRMVSNSCVIGLNEQPYTSASFDAVSYKSAAEYQESKEEDGFTAREEKLKVNDREFVILEKEDEEGHFHFVAILPWGDGSFHASLDTGNCNMEQDEKKAALNANLQTILENLTFTFE